MPHSALPGRCTTRSRGARFTTTVAASNARSTKTEKQTDIGNKSRCNRIETFGKVGIAGKGVITWTNEDNLDEIVETWNHRRQDVPRLLCLKCPSQSCQAPLPD